MAKFLEYVDGKIPNLVGIKFTSGNLEEGAQALNVCNKKYTVFLGSNQVNFVHYFIKSVFCLINLINITGFNSIPCRLQF